MEKCTKGTERSLQRYCTRSRKLMAWYAGSMIIKLRQQIVSCHLVTGVAAGMFVLFAFGLVQEELTVSESKMQVGICVCFALIIAIVQMLHWQFRKELAQAKALLRISEKEDRIERQLALEEFMRKYPHGYIAQALR